MALTEFFSVWGGLYSAQRWKACRSVRAVDKALRKQWRSLRQGVIESDIVVANTHALNMHAQCEIVCEFRELFNELALPNSMISWTACITGYGRFWGHGEDLLMCFAEKQWRGCCPDGTSSACVSQACSSADASENDQEIRVKPARGHLVEKCTTISKELVGTHAKSGAPKDSRGMLQFRDVGSWNKSIKGCVQQGCGEKALHCFKKMQLEGPSPDAVTFVGVLKACGIIGVADKGQVIHAQIMRKRLLEKHIGVGNALVDMYAKCGALEKAQDVFDDLPISNDVSWRRLIAGYIRHGHYEEAITCFEQMRARGVCADAAIHALVLGACGSVGAAYKGRSTHADIVRHGMSEIEPIVGMALLVMYADCGMVLEAQEVFDRLRVQDVGAWTALMGGYSRIEMDDVVLELFDEMIEVGLRPNSGTITIVSGSCDRRGLVVDMKELRVY